MYHRYFIVKDGPAIEAGNAALKKRNEAIEKILEFRDSIGAIEAAGHSRVTKFKFDNEPDLKVWKHVNRGFYSPRKNTNAGKEMAKALAALPVLPSVSDAVINALSLPTGPVIFTARYAYLATAAFGNNTAFVKIPWIEKDPAELHEYKEQRDNGKCHDSELNYLLTELHASMLEVKEWEFLKAMEGAKP
jgi:hypothetical protein